MKKHRNPDEEEPRVGRRVRETASELAGGTGRMAGKAKDLAGGAVDRGLDAAGDVAELFLEVLGKSRDRASIVWRPERPDDVLAHSSFFRPLPESSVDDELLNVLWRSEALLAVSILGVDFFENEITRFTRDLFHDGPTHQGLSLDLFGRDFDEIHRFMDTVPGSGRRGGGILHRVQHGHDAAALVEIYERHGLPGVLVWVQHNAQDLFTPTGVPLPLGSGHLADWLVAHDYATPGKAALLVSFNAAELVAAFLTGVFAVRLAIVLHEVHKAARIRSRIQRAEEARRTHDFDGTIANYKEAYALSGGSPMVTLALGWAYASSHRPRAEAFLCFREAALGLAAEDRTVEVGGVHVSLRGIAYLLALWQVPNVLDEAHMKTHWRDEIETMRRGAMVAFESTAIQQLDRPVLDWGPLDVEWRPRPMSGAANYYLAGRSGLTVPFLPQGDLPRLAKKADSGLVRAMEMVPESRVTLSGVRTRWAAELRPRETPLLETTDP